MDLKAYFSKRNKKESKSYLDFHLLVYLAKEIDPETIRALISTALENKPLLPGILEIIESIVPK